MSAFNSARLFSECGEMVNQGSLGHSDSEFLSEHATLR
jgi:hypothetical protein